MDRCTPRMALTKKSSCSSPSSSSLLVASSSSPPSSSYVNVDHNCQTNGTTEQIYNYCMLTIRSFQTSRSTVDNQSLADSSSPSFRRSVPQGSGSCFAFSLAFSLGFLCCSHRLPLLLICCSALVATSSTLRRRACAARDLCSRCLKRSN